MMKIVLYNAAGNIRCLSIYNLNIFIIVTTSCESWILVVTNIQSAPEVYLFRTEFREQAEQLRIYLNYTGGIARISDHR